MKTLLGAFTALVAASLIAVSAHAENLVLYTSQPNEDAQATVDAFKAANPGVDVEWVRDGTTKIMAKLMAEIEAGNPVADVLLIADTVTLQRMKEAGQLLNYKSPEAANYDAALYDADGAYYSTKMITTGIIYNTAASLKPAGWKDLTEPEAKGLVTMPSPLTSGAALIHAQTLTGIDGFGWGLLQGTGRKRRHGRRRQWRRAEGCCHRREGLWHGGRFHGGPRKSQGRTGRVRVSGGRRQCRDRAGGNPQDGQECRYGQRNSSISSCPNRASRFPSSSAIFRPAMASPFRKAFRRATVSRFCQSMPPQP